MKNLDKILEEPHIVKISEVKRIFRENNYEKEAVENWLHVNKVNAVREQGFLHLMHKRNNISEEEFWKLRKINLMKHGNFVIVFRAYKDYFNPNACFKDFFEDED